MVLKPLSTIFQLYRGDDFIGGGILEVMHRPAARHCHLYHMRLYRAYLAMNEIQTHNYHTVTTTVALINNIRII
jgi:hypothetical protein